MGDLLYCVGTALQVVAFRQGTHQAPMGAALMAYGLAILWWGLRP